MVSNLFVQLFLRFGSLKNYIDSFKYIDPNFWRRT